METIALPGRTFVADATLAHLSLRGANQFMAELVDSLPNTGCRFVENDLGEAWLLIKNMTSGQEVVINAFLPDSMHRAVLVAECVDMGLISYARKIAGR